MLGEMRILIVDDSKDDQLMIEDYLMEGLSSKYDVKIDCISNIYSAIALLNSGDYDLCFLDYQLGSIDGLELMAVVQSLEIKVPIIFVTGYGDVKLSYEAVKAGAVDYFPKSILSAKNLANAVEDLFGSNVKKEDSITNQGFNKRINQIIDRCRFAISKVA